MPMRKTERVQVRRGKMMTLEQRMATLIRSALIVERKPNARNACTSRITLFRRMLVIQADVFPAKSNFTLGRA